MMMLQESGEKTVGVIGGLGPQATLDFYSKLLEQTAANADQEHLHIIINSNPKVPNRQQSVAGTGPSCIPSLVSTAQALERAGADFLVMVCNTAHAYEGAIRRATNIPFISIIEESVIACLNENPTVRRVGLMAADGALEANLYQNKFAEAGVEVVLPNKSAQAQLMNLIFRIKANDRDPSIGWEMRALAQELFDQGAEMILAACTEIPLVMDQSQLAWPLISSTDALVEATIAFAGSQVAEAVRFADGFRKFALENTQHEAVLEPARIAAD